MNISEPWQIKCQNDRVMAFRLVFLKQSLGTEFRNLYSIY